MKAAASVTELGVHLDACPAIAAWRDDEGVDMADLVMIATMVGFVVLCIGYVRWCDRFIAADQPDGATDDASGRGTTTEPEREQVSA